MSSVEERQRLEDEDRKDGVDRREFLQILAGSFAAVALSGCDSKEPPTRSIPHLVQPEEAVPGRALWYASTCGACLGGCGILGKVRDGRPIKLEGNPEHPLTRGGLCARGQASVLDLYDSERLKGPIAEGKPATWLLVDEAIRKGLEEVQARGGAIRILSRTTNGPTMQRALATFATRYAVAKQVVHDSAAGSAIREAHRRTHGQAVLPWYRFEKARALVGFDADFLGNWISPMEFTEGWASGRKLGKDLSAMPWHAQFEARMSVTGANADLRVPVAPSRLPAAVREVACFVAEKLGVAPPPAPPRPSGVPAKTIDAVARRLAANAGRCLVVSGSADPDVQVAVNAINYLLGNYGTTLNVTQPSLQCQGNDEDLDALVDAMLDGKVDALIVLGGNPAYAHPRAADFRKGLERVALSVSLSGRLDETARGARYVCPDHHALEAWGDSHPHLGVYGVSQPLLTPLYGTRSAVESLLAWSGTPAPALEFMKKTWEEEIFPRQHVHASFADLWESSVRDGFFVLPDESRPAPEGVSLDALSAANAVPPAAAAGALELDLYEGTAIGDGEQANNPWLQELPDPISKIAWGNCASISPAEAKRLGVVEGRVLELSAGGKTVRLPAHVQLGMPDGVVAAALGYGRPHAGRIAANEPMRKMFPIDHEEPGGADLYPFLGVASVSVSVTADLVALAKTQTYDHQTVPFTGQTRPLVLETSPAELGEDRKKIGEKGRHEESLWPEQEYGDYKWGMAIDLNACTGCSACVIGCQAENNVPVVGKAEVRKNRDMAWMRLDRYYEGSEEAPAANPKVSIMPMLCQHCDHAPCETVCPVLATVHSSDGLNMQVYNRCVGTRYCANNCPYKVRRFNWFDYAHQDLVQNLVLNPDVTVRTRGVMEKCSFCVQRIAEARTVAKGEGRSIEDGEVKPACAQSCPAKAIVFGNMKDPSSKVSRMRKDPRAYAALPEIGTRPAVFYLKRVRQQEG